MDSTIAPTIAMSDKFFDAFARLPAQARRKTMQFLKKFRQAAVSNAINYEKIQAASPDCRSARIDDNYRVIISHPESGNVYLLLWVDTHDEAYRWARTHVCRVNPQTGSLQVFESSDSAPDMDAAAPAAEKAAPPEQAASEVPLLFKPWSDAELMSVGVPEVCLPLVRQIRSRDGLEALREKFPAEAFESLVWLSEGEPLDDVRAVCGAPQPTESIDEAVRSPRSQRSFRVIESDEEMLRIVDASLERWRVFLHPAQKRIAERESTAPMLVRGAAGTGKTVVAMHRAANLVRRKDWLPGAKLLFTTYTANLAVDISAQLDALCTPDEKRRIEVVNLDAWVSGFLRRHDAAKRIIYPGSREYDECWSRAMTMADLSLALPRTFYEEEWRRIVLPQEIVSEKAYLKAPRKGRGTPLSRTQRKKVWPVFDEMRSQMSSRGVMTIEDACFCAIHILDSQPCITHYQAVIVDEAQDFGSEALTLLARLALPDGNAQEKPRIFLAGDGQQRIYARQGSLLSCGIDVRGRSSVRLKLTYRTTEEIRKAANAVLSGETFDDMTGEAEELRGGLSNRHGVSPELGVCASGEEECAWIEERIREVQKSLSVSLSDICIVSRTNEAADAYRAAFQAKGFAAVKLSRKSDRACEEGLRFATMHRVKGLEFRVIFIAGASEGMVPLCASRTEDPEEAHISALTERSLFYVAASRARDALFVSCSGEPGAFMKLLDKCKG